MHWPEDKIVVHIEFFFYLIIIINLYFASTAAKRCLIIQIRYLSIAKGVSYIKI